MFNVRFIFFFVGLTCISKHDVFEAVVLLKSTLSTALAALHDRESCGLEKRKWDYQQVIEIILVFTETGFCEVILLATNCAKTCWLCRIRFWYLKILLADNFLFLEDENILAVSKGFVKYLTSQLLFVFGTYRHAAYRQFCWWIHSRLGKGARRVIPLYVVWEIRTRNPSEDGKYTGFKTSSGEVPESDFSWVGGME